MENLENKNNFWKVWFKFFGILIIIFLVWAILIFLGDKFLGKKFDQFKFVHYFILLFIILKAKKWFLKEIDFKKEDYNKNKIKK